MFAKENRFMTSGIAEHLPAEVMHAIWLSIDTENDGEQQLDYLQVFKFESVHDVVLAITHSQEEPECSKVIYMGFKESYRDFIGRDVFVIDDGDHSTMLFADEY